MTHLVISRVNLHMDLDPFKYKETQLYKVPGWNEARIDLLNNWARPSLKMQTCQDFTFISLWQKGHVAEGGELPNEVKIEIERTGEVDDLPLDYESLWSDMDGKVTLNYANQIRDKVRKLFKPPVIVTNLDCDDALRYDFIQKVQDEVRRVDPKHAFYFNNHTRYAYNTDTGAKGVKKTRRPSPTVSVYEPVITCYPLRYNHSYLDQFIPGRAVKDLYSLQTINGTNMFCRGTGAGDDFKLEDYK